MKKIILRARPKEVMEDINLDVILEHVSRLGQMAETEIIDSRLTDAPYITIIVKVLDVDNAVLDQLKSDLSDLAGMNVKVWRRGGKEVPLDEIDLSGLKEAAQTITTKAS
jgi:hypothetical protein